MNAETVAEMREANERKLTEITNEMSGDCDSIASICQQYLDKN